MVLSFSKEIYDKESLLKASYAFTDHFYLHLDATATHYIVHLEAKSDTFENEIDENSFVNEILAQIVRKIIRVETQTVRELLLARAFSSTVITRSPLDSASSSSALISDADLKDILSDWFEKYE